MKHKVISLFSQIFLLLFLFVGMMTSISSTKSIQQTFTLTVDQKQKLPNAADEQIVWSSADQLVATVSKGVIQAKGVGRTTITAKQGKEKNKYTVLVSLPKNKLIYTDHAILLDQMKKNAREYQEQFHFATRFSSNKIQKTSEARDVQIAIEKFLPQVQEFRVSYCDGWDVRYAYRREKNQTVYVEVTVTFDYNSAAAVAAYYRNQTVVLDEKEQALLKHCNEILEKLKIETMNTRWEKTLTIHDYIVANTAFDQAATQEENWRDVRDAYSAYGALVDGKATCKGYAQAMKLLLEASNVPCDYVVGEKNVLHAWNRVQLDDGEWYNIDASSNDPIPDKKGRVLHKYYCVTDEQLKKTHSWEDQIHICNATEYSYNNQSKLINK